MIYAASAAMIPRGSGGKCELGQPLTDSLCQGNTAKIASIDPTTGKLKYGKFSREGETILDYSTAGYNYGASDLPSRKDIKVVKTLSPEKASKDDHARIQGALDEISKLPLDKNGFRGTLQLEKGTYYFSKELTINASGVVLQGDSRGSTILVTTSEIKPGVPAVFYIKGQKSQPKKGTEVSITQDIIPYGSEEIKVEDSSKFKVGDDIVVNFHTNQAWIHDLGMDHLERNGKVRTWNPRDMTFYRKIKSINGKTIKLNGPITSRIEKKWGGASISIFENNRIRNVGIQDLEFQFPQNKDRGPDQIMKDSEQKPKDYRTCLEMFNSLLFEMNDVENSWIRNVKSTYFRNFVRVDTNAVALTFFQNSFTFPDNKFKFKNDPAPMGQFAFEISGQHILIDDCYVEYSVHAFSYKSMVAGPNVIRNSKSVYSLDVGPHLKWSSGQLYENSSFSGELRIENRLNMGGGHGWAGAYSLVWNCVAGEGVAITSPPIAVNGIVGSTSKRVWLAAPDSDWAVEESPDKPVSPISLYVQQHKERFSNNKPSPSISRNNTRPT